MERLPLRAVLQGVRNTITMPPMLPSRELQHSHRGETDPLHHGQDRPSDRCRKFVLTFTWCGGKIMGQIAQNVP